MNETEDNSVLKLLREGNYEYLCHRFEYQPGGGTARSSGELNIDEHSVVKTLVFQDQSGQAMIVLMHGDMRVDAKELARVVGVKKISSCAPEVAEKWSGWVVGSTNPFILKTKMPVYAESSIFDLSKLWINGGGRGVLVEITPSVLEKVVQPTRVRVGLKKAAERQP